MRMRLKGPRKRAVNDHQRAYPFSRSRAMCFLLTAFLTASASASASVRFRPGVWRSFLLAGLLRREGEENGVLTRSHVSSRSRRREAERDQSLVSPHRPSNRKKERKKFQGRLEGEERDRSGEEKRATEGNWRDRDSSRRSDAEEEEEEEEPAMMNE